jgi:hypothetical protein
MNVCAINSLHIVLCRSKAIQQMPKKRGPPQRASNEMVTVHLFFFRSIVSIRQHVILGILPPFVPPMSLLAAMASRPIVLHACASRLSQGAHCGGCLAAIFHPSLLPILLCSFILVLLISVASFHGLSPYFIKSTLPIRPLIHHLPRGPPISCRSPVARRRG